jgi:hypothetical protein
LRRAQIRCCQVYSHADRNCTAARLAAKMHCSPAAASPAATATEGTVGLA